VFMIPSLGISKTGCSHLRGPEIDASPWNFVRFWRLVAKNRTRIPRVLQIPSAAKRCASEVIGRGARGGKPPFFACERKKFGMSERECYSRRPTFNGKNIPAGSLASQKRSCGIGTDFLNWGCINCVRKGTYPSLPASESRKRNSSLSPIRTEKAT
jgi:hypothetical protein